MSEKLINTIRLISTYSAAIPFLIGWIYFNRASRAQKLLTYLVTASIITEVIAMILSKAASNNIAFYNIYAVVNFNLIWFIYQSEFDALKNKNTWMLQGLINLFAIGNAIFIQPINIFNSNVLVLCSISYLILAFYSFRQILKSIRFTRLEKSPIFWINTGVIIYYSGTLILFLLSNQINNISESANNLHLAVWALNSSFNFILIVAYSIALWVRPTK